VPKNNEPTINEIVNKPKEKIKKVILCDNPLIFAIDNYLSADECKHFIELSSDKLKRAVVSGSKKGDISNGRTGQNHWIEHNLTEITSTVGKRIEECVEQPLKNAEKYQVIYYNKNQEYRRHYDSWEHDYSEKTLRCIRYGGARLYTALCYLNDVEEGGGTNFPKLDITVKAKKGRLLVFQNTYNGTHNRHIQSEHAGMPVIKGEKWAFNLWFRECPRTMLYKDFNPEYYKNGEDIIKERIRHQVEIIQNQNVYEKKFYDILEQKYILKENFINVEKKHKCVCVKKNFIDDDENKKIITLTNFESNTDKQSCWIKKELLPRITKKIENITRIPSEYYENFNAIKYNKNYVHNKFQDAYDLKTERGFKYCQKLGQRIYSVVIFLNDNTYYKFHNIDVNYNSHANSILIYKNTHEKNNQRNENMVHSIANTSNKSSIILNLYIREKSRNGKSLISNKTLVTRVNDNNENKNIQLKITEKEESEDYMKTYDKLFEDLNKNKVNESWKHNSFNFTHKLKIEDFVEFLKKIQTEKNKYDNKSLINPEILTNNYKFDEYNPLALNNILREGVINIFSNLYKNAIKSNIFPLGDRQSNRYKAHNESVARVLHYEILPVIEKITSKNLEPTYTYTSFYVKGADLPSHTDRPECQFTVSFIVDKPEGSTWNIYVDPKNQPVKNKGRCKSLSDKKDCIPVDCEANGLMIFCGEDHAHFREKLEHDYYNILLLHYREVN